MITYLVGIPGSGKTYFAVYKLWDMFIRKDPDKKGIFSKIFKPLRPKHDYLYAYTNIDGFKFELDERLLKFDFDKFYADMEILYSIYLDKKGDAEIIEVAKSMKLFKVIFVIDECHNFLRDKENPVLVWWLTYHRHLSHDIYLITQDLSLVNNEYKRIAEKFYKAIDSSKRIFLSTFKYAYFSSYKMNISDRVNSFNINIPFNQEVYDLYHSGNKTKSRSIIRYFLFILFIIIFITLVLFYYSYESIFGSKIDNSIKDLPPNSINNIPNIPTNQPNKFSQKPIKPLNEPSQSSYYYTFSCLNDICKFKNSKITFPYSYISYLISSQRPIYFYSNTKNRHLVEYFLVFDKPVLDELKNLNKKGAHNEETNPNFSASSIFK